MALDRDNLNDALAAYGYLERGRKLYSPASVQTYALPAYNICIMAIQKSLDYIINNGYDNKAANDTLKKGVKTAYSILALKNTESGGSKFRNLAADADQLNRQAPQSSNSLGLNLKVNDCLKNTMDALKAMKEDMNDVDEAEYEKINRQYLQRTSYAGFEQWGETVKAVVRDVTKTLNDIKESLTHVVDNSSAAALQTATEIINCICIWRDVSVYSYLMLEPSMADALHEAAGIARDWSVRYAGVSRNLKVNPRADDSQLLPLGVWQGDQTQMYLDASRT
ncbi:MAG: hypothetical protein LUD50_07850 [Clostridia bacterium]|nr:hypothetical protein [Clostridia bacterium]